MLERYEIHQLAAWYLELIPLFILQYNGKYENRTNDFSLDVVPAK
jgi:hypothetical protein